jgi:flavodoxin
MPMPVLTFLEKYDWKGKTLVPFCTHEGSGLGTSVQDLKKLCPDAKILEGLAIRGSQARISQKEVEDWLQKNSLIR